MLEIGTLDNDYTGYCRCHIFVHVFLKMGERVLDISKWELIKEMNKLNSVTQGLCRHVRVVPVIGMQRHATSKWGLIRNMQKHKLLMEQAYRWVNVFFKLRATILEI